MGAEWLTDRAFTFENAERSADQEFARPLLRFGTLDTAPTPDRFTDTADYTNDPAPYVRGQR